MRPKGNSIDSVVIGELLNVDATEKLNGPDASITQRDWLVFTTKYVDPDIKPLKIRSKPLKTGERLWITGCPYRQESCFIEATQALEIEGSRIVFALGLLHEAFLLVVALHLMVVSAGYCTARILVRLLLLPVNSVYVVYLYSYVVCLYSYLCVPATIRIRVFPLLLFFCHTTIKIKK